MSSMHYLFKMILYIPVLYIALSPTSPPSGKMTIKWKIPPRKADHIGIYPPLYSQVTPTEILLYGRLFPFLQFRTSLWRVICGKISQYLKWHFLLMKKGIKDCYIYYPFHHPKLLIWEINCGGKPLMIS